jgi:very-short-patch-repair endonuclease
MRTLIGPRSAHDRRTLEQRARVLREASTRSEEALWRAIRARRLGVMFRRQVLIGRYIVDFVAPAARLVVEVDGSFHAGARWRTDARRDAALVSAGYRVLRLGAELVLRSVDVAVERIREAL